jgi:hypothetical protein
MSISHPQLHLVCDDPNVDLKVDMGDGPATPTAGYAAWETIKRVRRKSMTAYVGPEPFQQDVPVLLDGLAQENSVQRQLDAIESLGGSSKFRAFGPIHHPSQGPNDLWVFGGEPEFGEVIRDNDTTLFRQALTLKLMEFVSPDPDGRGGGRGKRGDPGRTGGTEFPGRTYTTVQGDTLMKVAHKVYGDWKRWKEIGQKNNISDPHRVLPAGRQLKL